MNLSYPGLKSRRERNLPHLADHGLRPAKPPLPRDIESTGMPSFFLVELLLKIFFHGGQLRLWDLTDRSKLPVAVIEPLLGFMRAERLTETLGHKSGSSAEVAYALTDLGRERALGALAKSQYAGPCPVTLESYVAQTEKQSLRYMHIGRAAVQAAFSGVVLGDGLLDQVGPALNSGRSIFIYGPSGSGKTYLAERLGAVLEGSIFVPHAIEVDNEIIQIFDPMVHRPLENTEPEVRSLDRRNAHDERWVHCLRPVVTTGGELTLAMLDLEFDATTRFYAAPPQLRANNGLLILDDLGRQRVAARDLLNRWIIPMDRRIDYLALHTGKKFRVPFDVALVFSTNLSPDRLADEAFLRRLGYKIHIGPMPEAKYREIFQQACSRLGVPYSDEAFAYLLQRLHAPAGRPLFACYPQDILSKAVDLALYQGTLPELSPATLDWAWLNYFGPDKEVPHSTEPADPSHF